MALKGARGTVTILDKATRPLRSIADAFKKMGNSSKKSNTELSKTQKAINGVSSAQNRLNRVNQKIKRKTRDIGSQAVGVAAIGYALKRALDPAIKFEQAMKDLESVAFGNADATVPVSKNMALLSDQAKQLGSSTRFSAMQAAGAQLFLAKAGFKTNQIISAMPALLDLAAASGTDLGRASDITSDLLGAFGMKAKDTGKLTDVLAAATSSANVDMETLFETLKVSAPIGIAAGQSMEGITTATALLGNVGIKGSKAGTALKNAFVNLAAPASSGSKVLKDLGIKTSDASGNMLPMQKIMMNLGKEAKNLSQVKRIQAFDAVFGKIAMAGAINLEKAVTSGDFDKMLKNLQNSEGVAKKMAQIRMDSTEGSIVQLMSATEGLAIAMGTFLVPALRGIADILTAISTPMKGLIKNHGTLIKVVGVFVGILFASKLAVLAYTASMWLITPAISALSFALSVIKTPMIVFNALMAANPVGLVVAGVLLLVAAGTALYANWEPIGQFFSDLWDTLKGVVKTMTTMPDIPSFGDIGSSISDTASGAADSVSSFFGGTPDQATQSINQNTKSNIPVAVHVNIADGKVKGVETSGTTKSDIFLNNGRQS
jgi:TP901 family phage tail tape measure protein